MKPSYDSIWIRCSELWPQSDIPVIWKPYGKGSEVPPQFIASMDSFPKNEALPQNWSWAPTGIYREMAWENKYLQYCGLSR